MYIDLTWVVSRDTPVYPGSPPPAIMEWSRLDIHGYYSNVLYFPEHVGTHVDAPAHFVPGGKTIDQVDVSKFFGRFVALDFSHLPPGGVLKLSDFEKALPRWAELGPGWVVLIKFGFDVYAGTEKWLSHPDLSIELAEHLARLGVNAVGVDAPSPDHPPFEVHKVLLSREVLIYENLTNLSMVVGRSGRFIGLPIKVHRGSGAPVRALVEI
ncbi:MAG: cyclase family protein [Pyrobaculum sp.]